MAWSLAAARRRVAARGVGFLALLYSIAAADAGAATGELRWSRETGAPVTAAGVLAPVGLDADGNPSRYCYIVGNAVGEIHAFEARTGDACWKLQRIGGDDQRLGGDDNRRSGGVSDLRVAPVPLPGLDATVFAVPDGRVVAVDNATGKILWSAVLHEGIEAPPTVALDGTVIVGTVRSRIHRLDGATGERIGRPIDVPGPLRHGVVATPLGEVIVASQSVPNGIVVLDSLMSAEPEVTALLEVDLLPRAAPVLDQEGRVVVAIGEKVYVRPPVGETTELAQSVSGLPVGLALTLDGSTAWLAATRTTVGGGTLQAFGLPLVNPDAQENDESTSSPAVVTPSPPTGAPAVGNDGSAYVALRGGVVWGVDATGARRLEYSIGQGEFRAVPVIGAGALFVGDTSGTVHAVDLDESAAGVHEAPWPTIGQNAQRTGQELLSDYKLPGEVLERFDPSECPNARCFEVTAADGAGEALVGQMVLQPGVAVAVGPGRFDVKVRKFDTDSVPPRTMTVPGNSARVYSIPAQRLEIAEPLAMPLNADPERNGVEANGPKIFAVGSNVETNDRPLIWHRGDQMLYAATPGDWRIEWTTGEGTPFSVMVRIEWPRDPTRIQQTVAGAAPVVVTDAEFTHASVWPPEVSEGAGGGQDSAPTPSLGREWDFERAETGRFVVVLADEQDPGAAGRLAFIAVEVLDSASPQAFLGTRSATIGSPVPYEDDFPGQHQEANTTPGVLKDRARVNMDAGFHDRAGRTGPIVPVNLEGPGDDDDLLLAFYRRATSLLVAGEGGESSAFPGWRDEERFYGEGRRRLPAVRGRDVYWPARTARYVAAWPELGTGQGQARELVIAAPANELVAVGAYGSERTVYRQPDPEKPGYNPNEEHAYIAGDSLWALRSDLNAPETSEPYVLVSYEDPTDARAKMLVVKVVAENAEHRFVYRATAGDPVLSPPALNGVSLKQHPLDPSVVVEDRNGRLWAYRAGHRGESVTVVNHFCYKKRDGFDVPPRQSMDCPYDGGEDMYAWLSTYSRRQRAARGEPVDEGAPVDVRYVTSWPADPPTLRPGQTLTMAIDGLPQIHGVTGIKLLYQQSEELGPGEAARLLDVASPRSVELERLPGALTGPRIDTVDGKVFFTELPANLRRQLYFDRDNARLAFQGQYLVGGSTTRVLDLPDPDAENSVLMNVMSSQAVAQIRDALADAVGGDEAFAAALMALAAEAVDPILVTDEDANSDHLALVAMDTGATGYISLVVGNSEAAAEEPEVHVIYVDGARDRGTVMVLEHPNPFAEQVHVRHSSDFAGRSEDYEFEWSISQAPAGERAGDGASWRPLPGADRNSHEALITGLDQFPDLLVKVNVCRRFGERDCRETGAQYARGWLDRVSAQVNLFDSVLPNFRSDTPRTTTNMVQQAGVRYRGAVPLSFDTARRVGRIQLYETAYRRARALSIDNATPNSGLNNELQVFAGRLSDLYFLLANEAYADALDPTVLVRSANQGDLVDQTKLNAFRGQTRSLLEEELALLRGMGEDTLATREGPVYNRLRWGFSEPVDALYVGNYGIEYSPDLGEACGTPEENGENIDQECLAQQKYPQGHGDAYGHYLTALKVYYGLLRNQNFDWTDSRSLDVIGGRAVEVDYFEERKFAQAAVGRARTALEVANLTRRRDFAAARDGFLRLSREVATDAPSEGEAPAGGLLWGTGDWASRGGQGAYFDWVVGNALVPHEDDREDDDLLGTLDRESVEELPSLVMLGGALQTLMDDASADQHPLGVPRDLVPFDVGLGDQVEEGSSAFEILYSRTVRSLQMATSVLRSSLATKRAIAGVDGEGNVLRRRFADQEANLNSRLIELYGTPLSTDIGPGRPYERGYDGPDIERYHCVPRSDLFERVPDFEWTIPALLRRDGGSDEATETQTLRLTADAGICVGGDGQRESPGRAQADVRAILGAVNDLDRALMEYGHLIASIEDIEANLALERDVDATEIRVLVDERGRYAALGAQYQAATFLGGALRQNAQLALSTAAAVAEASPKVTGAIAGMAAGPIVDATSGVRAAALMAGVQAARAIMTQAALAGDMVALERRGAQELVRMDANLALVQNRQQLGDQSRVDELERHLRQEALLRNELYRRHDTLVAAVAAYRSTREAAQRLSTERNRVRTRMGADLEQLRYREMAFRLLRSEAADRYRTQFDAAQLDVLMLARQLDFETNYALGSRDRGRLLALTEEVVRTRTLGEMTNEGPSPSTGGLAGILHALRREYDDYETARGVRVPGMERLDIRRGLFGLSRDSEDVATGMSDDAVFRERLRGYVVPSIEHAPTVAGCCRDVPAGHVLVLPFATPLLVNGGNLYNHFGWLKGTGDDDGFNNSRTGTALASVRVVLYNYPPLLNAGPLAYLYPAGLDLFRGRGSGDGPGTNIRSWNIALGGGEEVQRGPVGDEPGWSPFVEGRAQSSWWTRSRDLIPFEMVVESYPNAPDERVTRQHYGRSVYNTQWYLIVPMRGLLPEETDTGKIVDVLLGDSGISNIHVVFGTRAYDR